MDHSVVISSKTAITGCGGRSPPGATTGSSSPLPVRDSNSSPSKYYFSLPALLPWFPPTFLALASQPPNSLKSSITTSRFDSQTPFFFPVLVFVPFMY